MPHINGVWARRNSLLQDCGSKALSFCVSDVEEITKRQFKDTVCHGCKKSVKVCRSRGSQRRSTRRTHYVQEEDQDPKEDGVYSLLPQHV